MENQDQRSVSRAASLPKEILDDLDGLNSALREAALADKARLVDRRDAGKGLPSRPAEQAAVAAVIAPAQPDAADGYADAIEVIKEPVAIPAPVESVNLHEPDGPAAWAELDASEPVTPQDPNPASSTLGGADPSFVPPGWHLGLAPHRPRTRRVRAKHWLRRNWPFVLGLCLASTAVLAAFMIIDGA